MTLSPGSRLGPYEILSPLGAGGDGYLYAYTNNLSDLYIVDGLK